MPFKNANVQRGLPLNSRFQVGRGNIDQDETVERGIGLPWAFDPSASYLYYDCAVGVVLDSGIVVHNRMPQTSGQPLVSDTLAHIPIDDPRLDLINGPGVNLRCRDKYRDVVQRMGHARYWFRLWGQALRAGYQVPIPGIREVGGVPVVPHDMNPQWAYNKIAPGGSYGGVILWHAQWSLWYTTLVPPHPPSDARSILTTNPSAHISSRNRLPRLIQSPYSQADDNAHSTGAPSQRS